jgi:peptidoglycan/LPS O-acetylase OafA/YrhL
MHSGYLEGLCGAMSWTTMIFLWALQGGIACAISQAKNRSGKEGFMWGALLGPIGIIVVLCQPKLAPPPEGAPPAGSFGWYPDPRAPLVGERYMERSAWSDLPPRLR